jgi:predicted SAM-dependent methyltransferase
MNTQVREEKTCTVPLIRADLPPLEAIQESLREILDNGRITNFGRWGHQWLYDREELHRRLREAGFSIVTDKEWGASDEPALQNRETRPDSLLICEAVKSGSNE